MQRKIGTLCVLLCWLGAANGGWSAPADDQPKATESQAPEQKADEGAVQAAETKAERERADREESRRALKSIRYLKPMNAKPLPDEVRTYLQENGYLIPQQAGWRHLNNVAQGRFFRRGQTDWAVLASKKGMTSILVFPNGECEGVVSLASTPTAQSAWVEGFQRWMATMEIPHLLQDFAANGEGKLPPINHEGINDGLGMCSVVHYFYQGKWLRLPGCD